MNQCTTFRYTLILLSLPLVAQESEHNRLAVQVERPWQSNLGAEFAILPIVYGDTQTMLSASPSVDLLVHNRWYISLSIPVYFRLPLTTTEMVPCTLAQGDLNLEGAWISHSNRGQHHIGISWTVPTGISETEAEQHNSIQTGGLLHRLSLSWQYTRYTDPVSLNLGFSLGTTIPGTLEEKFYWEPVSGVCTTGTTILINRWVALQLNLSQTLSLPPRPETQWLSESIQYNARLRGSLWYTEHNHTLAFELSRDMSNPLGGLGISVWYFYLFKPKPSASPTR